MNRLISVSCAAAIAAAGALASCGGSSEPKVQPLKYHLEESFIASVPMEQKNAMLQAQSDYQRAKAEHMKAEADHKDVGTQLDVAKNEHKQAKIDLESAESKKSAADDSKDMTRINAAMRDKRVAELRERATDQHVDALKARKKYLKKLRRYTEENMYAAEAKYELAKADLCRANNISPRGFAHQAYVDQQRDRFRAAQEAKGPADQERASWQEKDKKYAATRQEYDHARGVDTATTAGTGAPTAPSGPAATATKK
jgi:hypothetical protein